MAERTKKVKIKALEKPVIEAYLKYVDWTGFSQQHRYAPFL